MIHVISAKRDTRLNQDTMNSLVAVYVLVVKLAKMINTPREFCIIAAYTFPEVNKPTITDAKVYKKFINVFIFL